MIFKYPIDYNAGETKRRQENIQELRKEIERYANGSTEKLPEKVVSFADRYDLNINYVVRKLYKNDIDQADYNTDLYDRLCGFEKEPGRQNFHENTARDFLKKLPIIGGDVFVALPKDGPNALFIDANGNGVTAARPKNPDSTKSIDFMWIYIYNGQILKFYATHKYTRGEGGAQDNQFKDVEKFLRLAASSESPDCIFVSITDGDHYHKILKKMQRNRLSELKRKHEKQNILVSDSNMILHDVICKIKDWLVNDIHADNEADGIEEIDRLNKILDDYYK